MKVKRRSYNKAKRSRRVFQGKRTRRRQLRSKKTRKSRSTQSKRNRRKRLSRSKKNMRGGGVCPSFTIGDDQNSEIVVCTSTEGGMAGAPPPMGTGESFVTNAACADYVPGCTNPDRDFVSGDEEGVAYSLE